MQKNYFMKLFYVAMLVFLPAVLLSYGEDADSSVRKEWLDAYLVMERAEREAAAGKLMDAAASFHAAGKALRSIAEKHPDWNAGMLAYRIAYCRGRCLELEGAGRPAIAELGAAELRGLLKGQYARVDDLQAENAALRRKLAAAGAGRPAKPGDKPEAAAIAGLKAELERAKEAMRRSEMREFAWRQAASGAEKAKQALADALCERDDASEKLKEKELDAADLRAKVAYLQGQLKEADKWAHSPMNSGTMARQNELDAFSRTVEDMRAELAVFKAKEKARKDEKNTLREMHNMAAELEAEGDGATTARYWAAIAGMEPADHASALRAAVWYARIGMADDAQKWCNQFFARSFDDAGLLAALSGELMVMGKLDKALAASAWAAALAPASADARYALASVHAACGELPAAEAQYRKAVELAPMHAPSLMALATIVAARAQNGTDGDGMREARKLYARALKAGSQADKTLEAVLGL